MKLEFTIEFMLAALDPCNACPEPRGDCPPECIQRRAFEELQKHIEEYKKLKEKETPKKPERHHIVGYGIRLQYLRVCPACLCSYGCEWLKEHNNPKHCIQCGQALDWSDENDN